MGVITLKIDDELERKLRAKAGRVHGAGRGTISASVEEALKLWLDEPRAGNVDRRLYVAKRDGVKVAEASTLMELAKKLRSEDTDPRDVFIESLPPIEKTRHMGLRTRA